MLTVIHMSLNLQNKVPYFWTTFWVLKTEGVVNAIGFRPYNKSFYDSQLVKFEKRNQENQKNGQVRVLPIVERMELVVCRGQSVEWEPNDGKITHPVASDTHRLSEWRWIR